MVRLAAAAAWLPLGPMAPVPCSPEAATERSAAGRQPRASLAWPDLAGHKAAALQQQRRAPQLSGRAGAASRPEGRNRSVAAAAAAAPPRAQATSLSAQTYRKAVTTARRDKKAATGPKGLTEEQKQEIRWARAGAAARPGASAAGRRLLL